MINLSVLFFLCSLGSVVMSFTPGRHNFFLSPFNENFYAGSAAIDPNILPLSTSLEQKLPNQEFYSSVMASIRDTFNKDGKLGQTLDLKMTPLTKKRHYNQNSFDVLAGGGLG